MVYLYYRLINKKIIFKYLETTMDNNNIIHMYIISAAIIAYLAKNKGHGFFFYFIVSIILSPIVGIILLLSAP